MMENHDWSSIKGDAVACPYINNTLLPQAAWCERYYNPPGLHPSLPNYLWLVSGTNFGVREDAPPSVHHQSTGATLFHQLDAAGISWKCYAEDISGNACPDADSGQYAVRHVPFVYFDTVRTNLAYCTNHIRPFAEMAADLAGPVRFNFLVPNLTNDMHNLAPGSPGTRQQGDDWLAAIIPQILNSAAYARGGLVAILFDEGANGSDDGPIPAIFLSPRLKQSHFAYLNYCDHSSFLRTLQDCFGLSPYLGEARYANDMSALFKTMSITEAARDDAGFHLAATNLVAGRTNLLQFSTNLSAGVWINVKTNVAAGASQVFDDPAPDRSDTGYYRLREVP
jgi:hypothetical protein